MTKARIKGAVAPDEILSRSSFIDADPTQGFSVRSFHIQTAKMAPLSDIVVYGEEGAKGEDILSLALEIATAQREWRKRFDPGQETQLFNTFALSGSFQELEEKHPEVIAVDSGGDLTGEVMDFCELPLNVSSKEHTNVVKSAGKDRRCAKCQPRLKFLKMSG